MRLQCPSATGVHRGSPAVRHGSWCVVVESLFLHCGRRVGKRAWRSSWNGHAGENCKACPTTSSTCTTTFPKTKGTPAHASYSKARLFYRVNDVFGAFDAGRQSIADG